MRFRKQSPSVVTSVAQQTEAAAALARIAGQQRLADPRTNPAVRAHADQLRDEQHRRALSAEHGRLLRRHRVEDRRADHAEKTLEAIQQARQTSSPARSVMALHQGRKRYLGVTLAASLSLSVGSAMGVAHLAHQLGAPSAVGYIAEVGLTGLTTTVIMYRSHLGEHGGKVTGWQSKAMWLLMTVPLLATIVANALSNGAVGVFCSTGAAAFSLLSAVISDRSAATMRARATEVTTDDEAELRRVAMGDDLFTAVPADEPTEAERQAEVLADLFTDDQDDEEQADRADLTASDPRVMAEADEPGPVDPEAWVTGQAQIGADQIAAWLANQEPPGEGVIPSPSRPDEDGPQGAARDLPDPSGDVPIRPDHIDGDQDETADPERENAPGIESATAARRAAGAATRRRVASYMVRHPNATVEQIAAALGVSVPTVKRARRALKEGRTS
jgi:hypothetical protein